jgi:LIVCS family branched-chain amino acid:cation transporter
MFFGAGNLMFPLQLGQCSGTHWGWAMGGLFVAGIWVPFLGLISMLFYRCDREAYFAPLGKRLGEGICFLILCLIGPLGAGPRCINAAFGSCQMGWPSLSPTIFNGIFCAAVALCILNREKVVPILGGWLSPALLVALVVVICGGFKRDPGGSSGEIVSAGRAFCTGLRTGYQTMDLLASFFFSITIYLYLRSRCLILGGGKEGPFLLRFCGAAFLVGMGILSFVYAALVLLGSRYADLLSQVSADRFLMVLSTQAIGNTAATLVAILFALACLTTVVAVLHLFADFFRISICRCRISNNLSLALTLILTYGVSLLGFSAICKMLATTMEFLYPSFIALALVNVFSRFFWFNPNRASLCFYGILLWVTLSKWM